MDDRDNVCDVCGKDILYDEWYNPNNKTEEMEIKTPEVLVPPCLFGDGVVHRKCFAKLIKNQIGAGI